VRGQSGAENGADRKPEERDQLGEKAPLVTDEGRKGDPDEHERIDPAQAGITPCGRPGSAVDGRLLLVPLVAYLDERATPATSRLRRKRAFFLR
jgi:hypothetical protein